MYVQCQYFTDGTLMELDRLLCNAGYDNYAINVEIRRDDGHLWTTMQIDFKHLKDRNSPWDYE